MAGYGLALLRVVLGLIYLMHGYLALVLVGPGGFGSYAARMGYPVALAPLLAWYLIAAHLVGGALLVVGLWTRWAALAQLPIMASALFLLHFGQGFFLRGIALDQAAGQVMVGGMEYDLLVLVATVTLVLTGAGALGLDGRRGRS
jgi:putative oxidoreductase